MVDGEEISDKVRNFLRDHITSYEHLEVLLLLRRRADQRWSAEAVATELRVSADAAEDALAHLCGCSLLEVHRQDTPRSFSYGPGGPDLAATVDELARGYDLDRLGVMNLMNAHAIERVRDHALHMFADAFVLGRKKDKDG